jgi:hypothetical protein
MAGWCVRPVWIRLSPTIGRSGTNDMNNNRPRLWIAVVYALLLVLVIPWYWPAVDTRQVGGFPFWSLASLGAALATSVFTAWVYWTSDDAN